MAQMVTKFDLFVRLFFLMRGRGLGIRQVEDFCALHVITLPLVCCWRKAFLFHVLCPPRGYVLEKPLSSLYSDLWEGTWGSFGLLLCSCSLVISRVVLVEVFVLHVVCLLIFCDRC